MIKTLLFDFSRVILLPKDITYKGELNILHQKLSTTANYVFGDNFELNQPLLQLLKTFKDQREFYIFTSGNIQNVPEIRAVLDPIFKDIFSAQVIGLSKKDHAAYTKVVALMDKNPEEVLFIDDSPENVGAAKRAGLEAVQYTGFDQLTKDLQRLF